MRIPAEVARGPRRHRADPLPDLEAMRDERMQLRAEVRSAKHERTLGDDCAEILLAVLERQPMTNGRRLARLNKSEILALARRMRALGRAS